MILHIVIINKENSRLKKPLRLLNEKTYFHYAFSLTVECQLKFMYYELLEVKV